MTRKNQVIEHDATGSGEIVDATKEMNALSVQIIKEYGHGVPYDRLHYLNKARGHIMRSAEEVLELGRCLIVLKEHEPHGEWVPLLEELGVERTFAARTMQAAIKFSSNGATSHHLIDAAKSKSKLFELMVLDSDQLQQLEEGQTVAGLNLDDIDKMSVTELRNAIRKAREEIEDQAKVMETKNKKIDEQSKKIARIRKQSMDETVKQLREEITGLQNSIEFDIRSNFYNAINTLQESEGEDHDTFIEAQISQLEEALAFLRQAFVPAKEEWEKA